MNLVTFTACLTLAFIPIHLQAGESAAEKLAQVESEVRQMVDSMGKALKEADCKRVSENFGEGFTFYVNGRHIESREAVLASCRQIPRPFPETQFAVKEIRPLSEHSALSLRVLNLGEGTVDGKPKREVITQVWTRDDGQWRISHMHVSINDMPVANSP